MKYFPSRSVRAVNELHNFKMHETFFFCNPCPHRSCKNNFRNMLVDILSRDYTMAFYTMEFYRKCDTVFKNGPSKICGRQPLKNLKRYGLLKQTISLQNFWRLYSTKFYFVHSWIFCLKSILEYFVSNVTPVKECYYTQFFLFLTWGYLLTCCLTREVDPNKYASRIK